MVSAAHFWLALLGLWVVVGTIAAAVVCRLFAINPRSGEVPEQSSADQHFKSDGTVLPAGSVVGNSIHNGGI